MGSSNINAGMIRDKTLGRNDTENPVIPDLDVFEKVSPVFEEEEEELGSLA